MRRHPRSVVGASAGRVVGRLRALDAAVFETTGSMRPVAVARIVTGPLVLVHLWPFLTEALAGVRPADRFGVPWFGWLPPPPGPVWPAMLVAGCAAAVAVTLGFLTRTATLVCAVVVTWNLVSDLGAWHHNAAFLTLLLWGLALTDAGRALSVDRWRHPTVPPEGPLWPVHLTRTVLLAAYVGSGVSKALDPDWRSGLVLWDRVVRHRHLITDSPLPGAVADVVADVLTTRAFHAVFAPVVIATELFIATGLWSRRTRVAALWVAVWFHTAIEVTARVQVFSFAALAALCLWVTPRLGGRVVGTPHPRLVASLDVFGRYRIVPGDRWWHRDTDGREVTGGRAVWAVAARSPVTFPVAAPVWAWISRRGGVVQDGGMDAPAGPVRR